jgi:3-hydroxyisobutyrate dehydrogenase-like beta-hydroxyacid dehydrogenase
MSPVVAIIAPGAMGSAVGKRLTEHGVEVRTSLAGRSAASAARAREVGLVPAADEEIAAADFVLSIVPPGQALALVERLAPVLAASNRKPVYVDCNAVNPQTMEKIARAVAATGTPLVDAGIIGPPPRPGSRTIFYASGREAARFATLGQYGLDIRVMGGAIGEASAMKMSYAGITKGFTALGAAMMLAATRAGTAEALHRELAESQPTLLAFLSRQMPQMYPKAYRWIAEMEEIAGFVGEDEAARAMFLGATALYERIADDFAGDNAETAALTAFVKNGGAKQQQ